MSLRAQAARPTGMLDLSSRSGTLSLQGKRFGFLRVLKEYTRHITPSGQIKRTWICECKCGIILQVWQQALTQGNTSSCGCHGKMRPSGEKEYTSWRAMIQRCYNPRSVKYPTYGGKGITVAEEWRSFNSFLRDMGLAPSPRHTLDRFPDPRGNYVPGNVRWATPKEQARNKC